MSKLVVVMGCIEGMIPGIDYNAPHAERQRRLEEQRRLFYVALTRVLANFSKASILSRSGGTKRRLRSKTSNDRQEGAHSAKERLVSAVECVRIEHGSC